MVEKCRDLRLTLLSGAEGQEQQLWCALETLHFFILPQSVYIALLLKGDRNPLYSLTPLLYSPIIFTIIPLYIPW